MLEQGLSRSSNFLESPLNAWQLKEKHITPKNRAFILGFLCIFPKMFNCSFNKLHSGKLNKEKEVSLSVMHHKTFRIPGAH